MILYEWNRKVTVSGFLSELGELTDTSIVTAMIAYDEPDTGTAHMLVIHQALYFPTLDHNLLCPMQMRYSGVTVNDCPKHCAARPTKDDHSILLQDFTIPLLMSGVISYFPSRRPTEEERERFDSGDYHELTASNRRGTLTRRSLHRQKRK